MEKMALISYHDGHGDTCLRVRSVLRTEDRGAGIPRDLPEPPN